LAPIGGVCKHATHVPEHHIWEHFVGLDKRDQDRSMSCVDKKPLGADGLHPRAEASHSQRKTVIRSAQVDEVACLSAIAPEPQIVACTFGLRLRHLLLFRSWVRRERPDQQREGRIGPAFAARPPGR